MSSAADSLRQRKGIAALTPAVSPLIREVMECLGLHIWELRSEDDIHAFTALGPCLPIALTYWEALGNPVDDSELLDTADRFFLPDYASILRWAHGIRPRNLSQDKLHCYLDQATTPGGVTEAILNGIESGMRLPEALVQGIARSRELAAI